MTDIQEWARKEALKRVEDSGSWNDCFNLLVELIAKYEEPPTDPLLLEVRKIYAIGRSDAERWNIYSGAYDDTHTMNALLAALKRGMELEREKRS